MGVCVSHACHSFTSFTHYYSEPHLKFSKEAHVCVKWKYVYLYARMCWVKMVNQRPTAHLHSFKGLILPFTVAYGPYAVQSGAK